MNKRIFNLMIGLILVLCSIGLYTAQFVLFHDMRNTFFYLFQDIAFVPLQVCIVTIILDRVLSAREKREILRKMNVVISAFYSEVGIQAIERLSVFIYPMDDIRKLLEVEAGWKEQDFKAAAKRFSQQEYEAYSAQGNLSQLKEFLIEKRQFILSMFENTNLLEHDTFTDMLWALFHISDELQSRESLTNMPANDMEHLSKDIKRAYGLLVYEWVYYMQHQKNEYPYLFSLAVRKNPFKENSSVVIK